MSVIQKIKAYGPIHYAETIFNRFVPAWLFRFSVGYVYEFDPQKLCAVLPTLDNSDYVMNCAEQGSEAREKLRETTWSSVPEETSANDFGYSIAKESAPSTTLGGIWGGVESFHEDNLGVRFHFTQDQSWIYCAFVDKEARGMGVYKRVLSFAANDLVGKGYNRILAVIQPWNRASMRIHNKFVKRQIGKSMAIRIFSFCFVYTSGGFKRDRSFTFQPFSNPVNIHIS